MGPQWSEAATRTKDHQIDRDISGQKDPEDRLGNATRVAMLAAQVPMEDSKVQQSYLRYKQAVAKRQRGVRTRP